MWGYVLGSTTELPQFNVYDTEQQKQTLVAQMCNLFLPKKTWGGKKTFQESYGWSEQVMSYEMSHFHLHL